MGRLIIFILGVLVGGAGVWLWLSRNKNVSQSSQSIEKQERKEKILEMLVLKAPIVNNDVEKLLSVSDATAERYLQELENEGKLKQVGKTGKYVYYDKI